MNATAFSPDVRKRITVVTGHYGSGKTEFTLQYASMLAARGIPTAVVDLDIANPYFRSRERQSLLESRGIAVYSNVYNLDITADLPAITAAIRSPLENREVHTVVDAGGDDSGARVLIQFRKYFTPQDSELLCVVNANRPETRSVDGALSHIRRIEAEVELPVSGLVSNTHMLCETDPDDIVKGRLLCLELSRLLGIPLIYTLCPQLLFAEVKRRLAAEAHTESASSAKDLFSGRFLPFDELLMRERWLDAPVSHFESAPFCKGGDRV